MAKTYTAKNLFPFLGALILIHTYQSIHTPMHTATHTLIFPPPTSVLHSCHIHEHMHGQLLISCHQYKYFIVYTVEKILKCLNSQTFNTRTQKFNVIIKKSSALKSTHVVANKGFLSTATAHPWYPQKFVAAGE